MRTTIKTTNHPILFATDTYSEIAPMGVNGNQCTKDTEMKFAVLKDLSKEYNDGFFIIQPRVCKSLVEQKNRTKKSAEVFTPTWICNKMNNICDIEWFNNEFQDKKLFDACMEDFVHNGIFNKEIDEDGLHKWVSNPNRIIFSPKSSWETYVKSTRLEITCGEAPFIVSRYDATTGEQLDVKDRIGILDRKLRVIDENVEDKKPWFNAVCDAYKSVYGLSFRAIIF